MLMISNQCMPHYRRSNLDGVTMRLFHFVSDIMTASHLTRIGTPLSPSATRVMLLGAGELGKEVIIALQRFGVEVIAVDRYPNAPGMQVAHRSHVIAMTDAAALRAVIEAERPHLVVPEIEAIATAVLADVERAGIAEVIPTARAAQLTMNREGIRRLAAEDLDLPTSRYAFANSLAELQAAIDAESGGVGYPCVVKPVMSSSGKGQSVLRVPSDVEKAWNYALESGRVKEARVIVEAFVDFEYEITQLTVRAIGESGQVETFFCEPIGHVQVAGDYVESWQPQPMSPLALQRSREVAEKVTSALGGRGIFGVELFIKGDEVWFSEVSPRPHDTGLVTLASQRLSEFELHARAILGLPVDTGLRRPAASAVIYGGMAEQGIAFEGITDALAVPESDLRLFGKPESFVKRRMGVAVANADTTDEARARAKLAASRVRPVKFG
jgi:phosphoribosylglycinamide formyltransferase 2